MNSLDRVDLHTLHSLHMQGDLDNLSLFHILKYWMSQMIDSNVKVSFMYQLCSFHSLNCKCKFLCDCLPHSEHSLYNLDRDQNNLHLLHMQGNQGSLSLLDILWGLKKCDFSINKSFQNCNKLVRTVQAVQPILQICPSLTLFFLNVGGELVGLPLLNLFCLK